jgi:hypothetical protein
MRTSAYILDAKIVVKLYKLFTKDKES